MNNVICVRCIHSDLVQIDIGQDGEENIIECIWCSMLDEPIDDDTAYDENLECDLYEQNMDADY